MCKSCRNPDHLAANPWIDRVGNTPTWLTWAGHMHRFPACVTSGKRYNRWRGLTRFPGMAKFRMWLPCPTKSSGLSRTTHAQKAQHLVLLHTHTHPRAHKFTTTEQSAFFLRAQIHSTYIFIQWYLATFMSSKAVDSNWSSFRTLWISSEEINSTISHNIVIHFGRLNYTFTGIIVSATCKMRCWGCPISLLHFQHFRYPTIGTLTTFTVLTTITTITRVMSRTSVGCRGRRRRRRRIARGTISHRVAILNSFSWRIQFAGSRYKRFLSPSVGDWDVLMCLLEMAKFFSWMFQFKFQSRFPWRNLDALLAESCLARD